MSIDIITDLLIDFDEMGFVPTTLVPDPEGYAIEWKKKLTDALHGYRKQSEWISVEERLPDKKEYDWVLVNVLLTSENYYGVPQIAELRNGKWWGYDDFPLSEVGCKVTHWMPLPEVPKMRKEGEGK